MRVGFIGLGSQGAPMARRIIEGGFGTTLWARRPAAVQPFADTPAEIASSPAELAAASDLVCLCVVGEADIEEIANGEHGLLAGLKPDSVIAVHSTVHPDTCKALAESASSKGVSVIDAPVSGGGPAAAEGHLMVMVGGDTETVERCRPVFETYGDPVVHLGELGTGQTTKLLNNLLFTANLGTAATALTLAQSLGVAPERLVEVVSRGSGNSFALSAIGGSGGLDRLAGLAGTLLQKDVRLIVDLAEAAAARGGAVLDAADAALAMMDHPR
ncbi:NAD(P)-dependent oxidoreductase [Mycobacterium montefiorense]|uniref:6-phosphogluconate dehydrogenase n=1 Tax=Mycobacterium montefiorense TaxID=154654 RepID=A0AA37UPY0_9MYCO|nr:NAD(P)-dependent oxidoreductase [Mycobacterium montefiorense]GBG40227.1 6-phosphogluconate dehydrogenase [Mycobacterium montefiorense]GKU35248.1 6-phosphogluconate dehydrogenase [Mycobacterium montefiorense]GKU40202.1 6-phosphogluconate dehydrogenase [Mycobacterium montefiorense]GKU46141.1 6-phosphogluconate dehydrogenase [Mycobacterium montefiorense]GKU53013.1 6-phosphogluconate dehydrogenase [Mycobacterium montefiorense]